MTAIILAVIILLIVIGIFAYKYIFLNGAYLYTDSHAPSWFNLCSPKHKLYKFKNKNICAKPGKYYLTDVDGNFIDVTSKRCEPGKTFVGINGQNIYCAGQL